MLCRIFTLVLAGLFGTLTAGAALSANLSLSPAIGPPTAQTTVTGSGFGANVILDVYFDTAQVAFQATSASGAFTLALKAPASAEPGGHTITVMPHTGTGASAQRVFTVRTDWTQWHRNAAGTGQVATENVLNYSSVSKLGLTWTPPGPAVYTAPLLVNDNLYYISSDKHLRSFSRSTRAPRFDVNTTADYLIPPVFGGNKIFVAGSSKLAAHSAATGALVWQADLPPGVGAPVVSENVVYVVAEGSANAGVYAFDINCGTGGATCQPVWRAAYGSAGYYYPETSLSVGHGKVFAVVNNVLYAFAVGCNTGGGLCTALISTPNVQSWMPVFSNNFVYAVTQNTSNNLYYLNAFRQACIGCGAVWTAVLPANTNRAVAVGGNQVFVISGTSLMVFPAACGATTCLPNWTTTIPSSSYSPSVAGDLVFVPGPTQLVAFPVNCYNSCPGRWHAATGGVYSNANYASVAVADGVVYAPDDSGLNVFSLANLADRKSRFDLADLKPSKEFAEAERQLEAQLAARRK